MKRRTSIGTALLLALALAAVAGEPEGGSYGGGVTLDAATPIEELLGDPPAHAGETLRIDGVVTEVCPTHGDWLKVSAPRSGSGVLVVLGEKVSVPAGCRARRVSVQGTWVALTAVEGDPPSEDAAVAAGPHVCAAMTRDDVSYHLRATGVVVH